MVSNLKIDARRNRILELLERDGRVSIAFLSEELGATPVTIRTDLAALENNGYLERIKGGAIRKAQLQPVMPSSGNLIEKQAVAAAVAAIIRDGDTLFLNAGKTTREVAMALKEHRNLSVVTNSVAVASELSGLPTFHVILLGGELNTQYLYTCGGDTQEQLRRYQADYAILSVDGVSAEHGITTYHGDEAIIDRLMVERAKRVLIAADSSKLGRAGFSRICSLNQTHILITNRTENSQQIKELEESNIQIQLADPLPL